MKWYKIISRIFFFSGFFLYSADQLSALATDLEQFPEKPLVVIIPSYNNKDYYKQNLESIFNQKYENYSVIYIDDASEDGTADLVKKYIKEHKQEHRCLLIENKTRERMLANLYRAAQLCPDEAIIIQPDGDDYLSDEYVFQRINKIYSTEDVWITYGSFINWPTQELGYCKPLEPDIVEKQWLRRKWWMPGQLRTFKAWLFKQIKLKDLIFTGPYWQGDFFPANGDLATCYPMMEMAGFKYKFIEEVIYIRNLTPINDFKVNKEVQVLGSHLIRHQPVYSRLNHSLEGYFDQFAQSKADIIIFSRDNNKCIYSLLDSINSFVYNAGTITVLYDQENTEQVPMDTALQKQYAQVQFVAVEGDWHAAIQQALQRCTEHILFVTDGMVFNRFVDLHMCIDKLERTFAYAFFLSLDMASTVSKKDGFRQEIPPLFWLCDDILGWMIGFGKQDWAHYHNPFGTLYRKSDLLRAFASVQGTHFDEIMASWAERPIDLEQVALFFDTSRIGYSNW